MSSNDVSVVLAHLCVAWRWSWAKLIDSVAAHHGEKAPAVKWTASSIDNLLFAI
jgi:hypothetical protein